MNKITGRKRGNILMLTLLVMMVGAIIMAVFFQYLGASLALAIRGEENANTFYAADSGFEDAFYWLQQDKKPVDYWAWNEGEQLWIREAYEINDRTVDVRLEDAGDYMYKITSRAVSDESRNTVIESYVRDKREFDLTSFGQGAVTSKDDVQIWDGSSVDGDVTYVTTIDGEEHVDGTCTQVDDIEWWPTTEQLTEYYLPQVDTSDPFPDNEINVRYVPVLGPLYRDGQLSIMSLKSGVSTTLNGTIYVTGNLYIGKTKQGFTLDLNGHTIFCEGSLDIGAKTTITGSGGIISCSEITFAPNVASDEDDFIFIMAAYGPWDGTGDIDMQPNGTLYGSVAGYTGVELQPGSSVIWRDPSGQFTFPKDEPMPEILTYTIVD